MFEHLSIRPIINGVGYAIRDHAAEYASWQAAIDRIYKGIGDLPELRITRLASGMNGQIQETGPNLVSHSEDVIEADDLIVAPGLIDLHVHVFSGIGLYSIDPFAAGLRTGVTTMLDTGTAGALTYANMARFIIPSEQEDVFALLNVSMIGAIQGHPDFPPFMGDLNDGRHCAAHGGWQCRVYFGIGRSNGACAQGSEF